MTSKETINYLFKKYFVGISQEKGTGRWFIDMREIEGSDLAILMKLCKEGFEND